MHEAKLYAGFSKCNMYVHCYSFVRLQELMLMTMRHLCFFDKMHLDYFGQDNNEIELRNYH